MLKRFRPGPRRVLGLALVLAAAAPPAAPEPAEPAPTPPAPVGVRIPLPPPPPPEAPAPGKHRTGPAEGPVTAEFEFAEQWKEGPFLVIFLTGGVTITKGAETLQADSIVGWSSAGAAPEAGPTANLDVVKRLEQVYAEGHVRITRPERGTIIAEQVFIDLRRSEGIFLDFRARTQEPRSKQSVVIRAAEARQVTEDYFVAQAATVTTCTYGTPHYDITVRRLEFERKPGAIGVIGMDDMLLRVDGVPLAYWPLFSYDLSEPFPLRRINGGNSSRFGPTVLTEWGVPIKFPETDGDGQPKADRHGRPVTRKWGDLSLDVDFRNERGWATGPGLKYDWQGEYEGFLDTYYLHDRGRNLDNDFDLALEQSDPLTHEGRVRVHDFHRHRLDEHWRLDVETHYVTDRNLLLEFFPREYHEEKEPESYLLLRGLFDNWGITLLERNTLNPWQTQVEYMPQIAAAGIAQPVWPEVLPGLYLFTTNAIDDVRWHYDNKLATPSDTPRIWRFDTAHELWYPVHLGPLNLAPFAGGRWSVFQETLTDAAWEDRFIGTVGGRAEVQAHRVYRFDWDAAGLHDLRHVVSAEVRYANNIACTTPPDELIAFDHVEAADKFQEIALRLNQHFQTKVGPEGQRRTVDFLFVGAALELYPDPARDTTGPRPQNYLAPFHWITLPPGPDGVTFEERRYSNLFWTAELTPADRWSIRMDEEYDLKDGHREVTEITGQIDIASWLRASAGYYEAYHISQTLRFTAYIQPTSRLNLYAQYERDLHTGDVTGERFAAQWDMHDIYLEVAAKIDPIRDEKTFLVGVSPKFGGTRSLFPHERESGTPYSGSAGPTK